MAEKKKKGWRLHIWTYVGLAVSVLAIIWVAQSVEQEKVFTEVREIRPFPLILAILLTISSYVLRSWRWPFFFGNNAPRFFRSFRCVIIGFFMNNVLPARMGELVRAHVGGRDTGESRATVLATIAGERLVDGLAISLIFALLFTFFSSPQEKEAGRALFFVAYLFFAASAATVIVILSRRHIFSIFRWLDDKIGFHLFSFFIGRLQCFIEGLEPMFRPKKLLIIAASSALVWFVELAVYVEISQAFDCPMTVGGLSLFLAAVNFSSLIPAAPAGVGVIEAFTTAALNHIGIGKETALAMTMTQHLIQFSVVGIPGAFFFFFGLHGKVPGEETGSDE